MLKLSKKVEYALLAIQYLAAKEDNLVTAKEMSSGMNVSFEFLSKSLQALMKSGLVNSQQGIKGGYFLSRKPDLITLADVIRAVDEKTSIVDCSNSLDSDTDGCVRVGECTLMHPMHNLQKKIDVVFENTTMAELLNFDAQREHYDINLNLNNPNGMKKEAVYAGSR